MTPAPAFKHIGGDLIYRGRWLSPERAQDYDAFFRREALLAHMDGDDAGFAWANELLTQLVSAKTAQAQWVRVMNIRRAA